MNQQKGKAKLTVPKGIKGLKAHMAEQYPEIEVEITEVNYEPDIFCTEVETITGRVIIQTDNPNTLSPGLIVGIDDYVRQFLIDQGCIPRY